MTIVRQLRVKRLKCVSWYSSFYFLWYSKHFVVVHTKHTNGNINDNKTVIGPFFLLTSGLVLFTPRQSSFYPWI